jgi:Calcineurin-like phosphoesterase
MLRILDRATRILCNVRVARALALAAAAPLLALCACAADDGADALPFVPGPGQGVFLIISDIHFDPFADPAIVEELVAADVDAWPGIFERSQETGFAPYGSDTNYPLLRSALEAAQHLSPRPDFVLYPGDYLAHGFAAKFRASAGGGSEAYRDFVIKTMAFVSKRLEDPFPAAPVYGTLGNADSIWGDYMIAPGETFLAAVGELWAGASAHPQAFADFGTGGFYAVPHPRVKGRDLIVLNNVFWSANYDDRCNAQGGDPGAAQLAWLDWILYRTALRGRTASLLFHIPPGIDSFNRARQGHVPSERHAPQGGLRRCVPDAARGIPGDPGQQLFRPHPHGQLPGGGHGRGRADPAHPHHPRGEPDLSEQPGLRPRALRPRERRSDRLCDRLPDQPRGRRARRGREMGDRVHAARRLWLQRLQPDDGARARPGDPHRSGGPRGLHRLLPGEHGVDRAADRSAELEGVRLRPDRADRRGLRGMLLRAGD